MVSPINQNVSFNNKKYNQLSPALYTLKPAAEIFSRFNEQDPKTALNPSGRLVKSSFLNPVVICKTYLDSAKNFYKALKGEGNDHTIGKLNDAAIRLGSLGIATVLATGNKTLSPSLKGMEFVGAMTFFSAMSLWPKVFIGAPLKGLKGFDFTQEYVDSYGRRRRFFEDPQYLTWDLWSDEKINKVGDKLKIPKDIPNRREVVQDKMKQIATQANTLWMLTAGFSTPILTSLICDQLRFPVRELSEKIHVKIAEKKLGVVKTNNKTAETTSIEPSKQIKAISEAIKNAANDLPGLDTLTKNNPADLSQEVIKLFNKELATKDPVVSNIVKKSIENIIGDKTKLANEDISKLKKLFAGTKSLLSYDKLWNGFYREAIGEVAESNLANSWDIAPKRILKAIGISERQLAACEADVAKTELITKHLEELAKDKTKFEKVVKKISKIVNKTIKQVDKVTEPLERAMTELEKIRDGIADQELKEVFTKLINGNKSTLENRNLNAKSSFYEIINLLNQAQNGNPQLSKMVHGLGVYQVDNDDFKTFFGNLGNEIKKTLGDGLSSKIDAFNNIIIKRVGEVANQNTRNNSSLSNIIGKTPEIFLYDAAKELKGYHSWLRKVGGMGAGLTLITLFALTRFGKTNKYNPEVCKEGIGHENSK